MADIPAVVRRKAEAVGAQGWVAALPSLIDQFEREWSITTTHPFDGGTESYVVGAECADGTPAVLKLLMPRDDEAVSNEITALRLADGRGGAALLASDVPRGALLLERLGRPMADLGLPLVERQRALALTAREFWRVAPDAGLPSGATKGRWLTDFIVETWEALNRPVSERVVDHAVGCAERRIAAHDDRRAVLVHGDVHQSNALEAEDGFRLIDPDGLIAEPEYDLGVIMREDPVDLIAGDPMEWAHRLAALTDLDATAIWEWGVVERVSTGLLCTMVDLQPAGRDMLEAASAVAD